MKVSLAQSMEYGDTKKAGIERRSDDGPLPAVAGKLAACLIAIGNVHKEHKPLSQEERGEVHG